MISISRTLTLFKKDILWSMANLKLLAVMILPVVFLVLLSRDEKTFVFSIIFVNVFIGLFSTSYLVIEEKNKGTLLALMTSPLQSIEVLLGKFLFNLMLCMGFSLLGIFLNQRFDLLAQPLVLVNILFFAGTTCFIGFIMGLFFKNEQEMSVIAPLLMFIFSLGDLVGKVSSTPAIKGYFPDFHLAQVLNHLPLPQTLWHTLWNFSFFTLFLLSASFYAQFYFSNSRERRFSSILFFTIAGFLVLNICSGLFFSQQSVEKNRDQLIEVIATRFRGSLSFSSEDLIFNKIHQSPEVFLYEFKSKKKDNNRLIVSVRNLENDENTQELRNKKVKTKPGRQILSESQESLNGISFNQWIYIEENQFLILKEFICGQQIFQISVGTDFKEVDRLSDFLKSTQSILNDLKIQCLD